MNGLLDGIVTVAVESLKQTSLQTMMSELKAVVCAGKMLRSRLILRVGPVAGVPIHSLSRYAACVEMIHAASLLHDDVIDGSHLRRGAPTFWLKKGVPGAILVGDLLICRAVDVALEAGNTGIIRRLVQVMGEMCNAEVEQELVRRGTSPDWNECVSVARRKTGSLFAFAASVCGGTDKQLCSALTEAGYLVGTAYQLADDILDVYGDPLRSDKTLGSDAGRGKPTTFSSCLNSGGNPVDHIGILCEQSAVLLAPWPAIFEAWRVFLKEDMQPCICKYIDDCHVVA